MSTALYYSGEIPPIGTVVMVRVDSANRPSGNWLGVVDSYIGSAVIVRPGDMGILCEVTLTDPGLPEEWRGKSPDRNTTAYVETAGTHSIRTDLNSAKKEIAALRRRLDTERNVFHGLMRALIGGTGLENLKTFLKDVVENATSK